MIMMHLWLMHTVGALLLTLLIYEHMGSVQGQFDAPLSPCRVHGDQPVVAAAQLGPVAHLHRVRHLEVGAPGYRWSPCTAYS